MTKAIEFAINRSLMLARVGHFDLAHMTLDNVIRTSLSDTLLAFVCEARARIYTREGRSEEARLCYSQGAILFGRLGMEDEQKRLQEKAQALS